MAHTAVSEAAVIGIPDAEWGEAVAAVVVLHPGGSASEAGVAGLGPASACAPPRRPASSSSGTSCRTHRPGSSCGGCCGTSWPGVGEPRTRKAGGRPRRAAGGRSLVHDPMGQGAICSGTPSIPPRHQRGGVRLHERVGRSGLRTAAPQPIKDVTSNSTSCAKAVSLYCVYLSRKTLSHSSRRDPLRF